MYYFNTRAVEAEPPSASIAEPFQSRSPPPRRGREQEDPSRGRPPTRRGPLTPQSARIRAPGRADGRGVAASRSLAGDIPQEAHPSHSKRRRTGSGAPSATGSHPASVPFYTLRSAYWVGILMQLNVVLTSPAGAGGLCSRPLIFSALIFEA